MGRCSLTKLLLRFCSYKVERGEVKAETLDSCVSSHYACALSLKLWKGTSVALSEPCFPSCPLPKYCCYMYINFHHFLFFFFEQPFIIWHFCLSYLIDVRWEPTSLLFSTGGKNDTSVLFLVCYQNKHISFSVPLPQCQWSDGSDLPCFLKSAARGIREKYITRCSAVAQSWEKSFKGNVLSLI